MPKNGNRFGKFGFRESSQKSILSIPIACSRRDEHGGIFRQSNGASQTPHAPHAPDRSLPRAASRATRLHARLEVEDTHVLPRQQTRQQACTVSSPVSSTVISHVRAESSATSALPRQLPRQQCHVSFHVITATSAATSAGVPRHQPRQHPGKISENPLNFSEIIF